MACRAGAKAMRRGAKPRTLRASPFPFWLSFRHCALGVRMAPLSILKYAHELFAFFYVAALLAAHWNVLAVRRTKEWGERAVLLEQNQRLSVFFSLGP